MHVHVRVERVERQYAIEAAQSLFRTARIMQRHAKDDMRAWKVWIQRPRPVRFTQRLVIVTPPEISARQRCTRERFGVVERHGQRRVRQKACG